VAVAILCLSIAALIYLLVTATGLIDMQGRPLGTDFSSFYATGTHVLDGHPEAPYDLARQHAREQAIFGLATPFYGWLYPPFFLFIAAALALLPYGVALATWQAVTLGLYLLAVRAILISSHCPEKGESHRRAASGWLLLALAFPAVLVNLGHGQNGFLTAALLGGALAVLDRRPLVAGLLFGLLAYNRNSGS
jgi:alpha-1,2-mannosyltransferase